MIPLLELAGRSWRYCRDATRCVRASQETLVLREAWRRFVHACPPGPQLLDDQTVSAGAWQAKVDSSALLLTQGTRRRTLAFPKGMQARIAHEADVGQAERWVLILDWEGRTGRQAGAWTTRLVACRGDDAS